MDKLMSTTPVPKYQIEVDAIGKEEWHAMLRRFDDAVIHQTWSFGASRWGEENLSHLVLKQTGEPLAAVQVVISQVPVLGAGIAHVKFGPMWRVRGQEQDPQIYQAILRAMRIEYTEKRRLLLRLKSWEPEQDQASMQSLREQTKYRLRQDLPHYHTFVIDLAHSLDELFKGLKPKWRYNLRRAWKRELEIHEIRGEDGVRRFVHLYQEMHRRKGYHDTSEIGVFPDLYNDLPEPLKPVILVCLHEGETVAGIVVSHIGGTGFYLFGATGDKGLRLGASYALHWHAIDWLKQRNCRWYDLVGSYPASHTSSQSLGYRQFKQGLVGKCGSEVHMGDADACDSLISQIVVDSGTRLKSALNDWRHKLNAWKRSGRSRQ